MFWVGKMLLNIAAVEICILLDERFEGFMGLLLPNLVRSIKSCSSTATNPSSNVTGSSAEKEEQTRLMKLRSCMRLLVELNLIGLARDGSKLKIVPSILFELVRPCIDL
jgi:hypothetical protein